MILLILGLVTGIAIGLLSQARVPVVYSQYVAVGVLATLDSVLGAWRAGLEGSFDAVVFMSGFFINTFLAGFLTFLGDKLGVDLQLGATVAFSIRIFVNAGIIRRLVFRKPAKSKPTAGAAAVAASGVASVAGSREQARM